MGVQLSELVEDLSRKHKLNVREDSAFVFAASEIALHSIHALDEQEVKESLQALIRQEPKIEGPLLEFLEALKEGRHITKH